MPIQTKEAQDSPSNSILGRTLACIGYWRSINDEIWPSINIKNRGIWQTNISYAFTSNLVPHVFWRIIFWGNEHKYIGSIYQQELSNSKSSLNEKTPSKQGATREGPSHKSTMIQHAKAVVERRWTRCGQAYGLAEPPLAPLATDLHQWLHGNMERHFLASSRASQGYLLLTTLYK